MKLSAARIFVKDLAATTRFYTEIFGLRVESDGSAHGYCVFETGEAQLIVEVVASDASQDDQVLVGRFTGLSFAVDDIQLTHTPLVSLGVEFSGTPALQFWGGWLATLKDPAGNEIQLVLHSNAHR